MPSKLLSILCLLFSCSSFSQVTITTIHQTANELKIKETLTKLYEQYELHRWSYKSEVKVDEKAKTPRSYPTVTMNANAEYLNSEIKLLSTFLHEQFHWHLIKNGKGTKEEFRAAIKAEFPEVQFERPFGSGTEGGTLSHIIVCYLEYKVLSSLIGEEKARINLATNEYYTWVYQTVLNTDNHKNLEGLLNKYALALDVK
ncbi:MAG: hypothetical protein HRT52_15270 [Colwellia sp.]|nr:hypothetical protein [Colwellia sp.]